MKPISLSAFLFTSIFLFLPMALSGCTAISELGNVSSEPSEQHDQSTVQRNVEAPYQVDRQTASTGQQEESEPNLIQDGVDFFNHIVSQTSNPDGHFTDLLPGISSFLQNEEQSAGTSNAQSSGSIDVQSLDNSNNARQSRQPNQAIQMSQTSGYRTAPDPYANGGITYHNSGNTLTRSSPKTESIAANSKSPQRATAIENDPAQKNAIESMWEGLVNEISPELSTYLGVNSPSTVNSRSFPAYSPPQRASDLQRFDGRSAGATAFIKRMEGDIEGAVSGRLLPPIAFQALPDDMSTAMPGNKKLFLNIMLPIVALVNEQIAAERHAIVATKYQGPISDAPLVIQQIARRYDVSGNIQNLLDHVDTLPISLILAQSIEESGWGTSRFSQEGNALFGQYTWDAEDRGIVPGDRPKGERFRIKAFPTLFASVQSYALNLNRHDAYSSLRAIRAAARQQGRTASSKELAKGLSQYSGNPGYYIPTIQSHIENNSLSYYDHVMLRPGPMIEVIGALAPASR